MKAMRLADPFGRDALIWLKPLSTHRKRQYRDLDGTPARSVQRWKGRRPSSVLLTSLPDPDQLSKKLIHEDPDVDLGFAGCASGPCDLVYLGNDGAPIHFPDYQEADTGNPWHPPEPNLTNKPFWSGRYFEREDLLRRVAFSKAFQLFHSNVLEFDFLKQIAVHLEERDQMVQVGSGRHGKGALFLQRGGKPYRGFLDGRSKSCSIRLVLYLTNQKLEEA